MVGAMLAYLKMTRAGKESFCEPAQDATLERIKNAPTSAANMRNPQDLLAPTVISGARKTMIQFIQELDDVHLGAFPAAGAESKRPAANIVSADALKNAHKEISARVSEEAGAKLATSGLADDGWDGEDDIAFGGAPVVPVGAPFATLGVSDDGDAHIASISASHPRGSPRAEPESAVADDMQALRDQVKALEAALAAKDAALAALDAALAAEVAAKDAVLATLEAVTAPPGNNHLGLAPASMQRGSHIVRAPGVSPAGHRRADGSTFQMSVPPQGGLKKRVTAVSSL